MERRPSTRSGGGCMDGGRIGRRDIDLEKLRHGCGAHGLKLISTAERWGTPQKVTESVVKALKRKHEPPLLTGRDSLKRNSSSRGPPRRETSKDSAIERADDGEEQELNKRSRRRQP
ncbi:Uncharacterized protein Rs2_07355 [Raphanus sativus]|nr:Uncharacterized protein Rs2_07355 [Raphanus sativus]